MRCFLTAAAPQASTPLRSIAMATSCRLVRCWLSSKGIEARPNEPKTRAGAPNRRRRPQCLAALVQHLLLGPACFHWSDERVLDLFLYRAQPLLSACRAALKTVNLAFQFPDPIFGSSQLKREPMRHGHRSLDVLFGDVSCFFQQTNHRVPSLINRFFGSWPLLRSKSHDFS